MVSLSHIKMSPRVMAKALKAIINVFVLMYVTIVSPEPARWSRICTYFLKDVLFLWRTMQSIVVNSISETTWTAVPGSTKLRYRPVLSDE